MITSFAAGALSLNLSCRTNADRSRNVTHNAAAWTPERDHRLRVVRVQYVDGSEFRESGYDALGKFFYTMHGSLSDRHFWSRKQQQ